MKVCTTVLWPNFFSSSLIFLAELAVESWSDLAAVLFEHLALGVHYVRMRFMRVVIHEWCSPYVWADIMLG